MVKTRGNTLSFQQWDADGVLDLYATDNQDDGWELPTAPADKNTSEPWLPAEEKKVLGEIVQPPSVSQPPPQMVQRQPAGGFEGRTRLVPRQTDSRPLSWPRNRRGAGEPPVPTPPQRFLMTPRLVQLKHQQEMTSRVISLQCMHQTLLSMSNLQGTSPPDTPSAAANCAPMYQYSLDLLKYLQ